MRTLAAIQAAIGAAFLIVGLVALFGIGITGLIFLAPGVAFAAIASVVQTRSRAGVIAALAADAVIACFAGIKIHELLHPRLAVGDVEPAVAALLRPSILDFVVPCASLVIVAVALVAVILDWRSVRTAAWF